MLLLRHQFNVIVRIGQLKVLTKMKIDKTMKHVWINSGLKMNSA